MGVFGGRRFLAGFDGVGRHVCGGRRGGVDVFVFGLFACLVGYGGCCEGAGGEGEGEGGCEAVVEEGGAAEGHCCCGHGWVVVGAVVWIGLLEAVSVVAFGVWFSWVWEVGS